MEKLSKVERQRKKKFTRKQLIEKMQCWTKEHNGRTPVARDFSNNPQYPSYMTYISEFGTWNKALEASEIKVNQRQDWLRIYTKEQLIEIIQQFDRENGKPPIERDFDNNPKYPSYGTYQREFGSWNNAKIEAGFKPDDDVTRGRQGELQTISEFKTEGAIDLSGKNRKSTCDGQCPKGELFDTKSISLTKMNNRYYGWMVHITENQLQKAKYLFFRAYKDQDFTKPPLHKWRVPIEFMKDRKQIFIYKDENRGEFNIKSMNEYEI